MMGGPAFFQTVMGRRFFEGTMPKIAEELARLNTTLAALVAEMKASSARANPPSEVPPADAGESWQATLAAIARQHFRSTPLIRAMRTGMISTQVRVVALRSALRAAYRAGFAAGLRHPRTPPTSEPADGSAEPPLGS